MPLSRHAALLWLSLALGAAAPAHAQVSLPAPVESVRLQLRQGNVDAAIEAGEKAVAALERDAQAWFWLGRAYAQQALRVGMLSKPKWAGKTREAYERAVALDPGHLDARFDLLQYYAVAPGFLGGGRDKADAQAATLRQRDPVVGKLAEAYLAQQDDKPELAERAYRDALGLAPDSARARVALNLYLQRDSRWDEMAGLWREVLARTPDDALAHYQHLQRYFGLGGESEYMTPAAAHWRRGQILEKLGRPQEALPAYAEAVRLDASLLPARESLERLQET
jgi:tetratricopeptide (TPR) repeat protein